MLCEKSLESAISITLEPPRAKQGQTNEPRHWIQLTGLGNIHIWASRFPHVMVMELLLLPSMSVGKKGHVRLSFPLPARYFCFNHRQIVFFQSTIGVSVHWKRMDCASKLENQEISKVSITLRSWVAFKAMCDVELKKK